MVLAISRNIILCLVMLYNPCTGIVYYAQHHHECKQHSYLRTYIYIYFSSVGYDAAGKGYGDAVFVMMPLALGEG